MAHEQVGIGGGHTGDHGRTFDLEEMAGVEGEIVVGKDKFLSWRRNRVDGWVWGGCWSRKCSRAERPWVWGMLVYREETSAVAMMVSGGRGLEGIGSYQGSC